MNQASCLCGKITFSVSQFEPNIAHCHCTMCQKFHGAAFSTLAEVKLANLTWLSGQKFINQYSAENETIRQFCSCCGSSLTFESKYNRQDHTLEVALALFDEISAEIKVTAHIYVRSKAVWFKYSDELPKFEQFRPPCR